MKQLAVAVIAGATLAGAAGIEPARDFYCSAHQFVEYYRAIEDSNVPAGFRERVAISLALTKSTAAPQPDQGCGVL